MNPLEFVSGLALRFLTKEQAGAMRNAYLVARTRMRPALKLVYGTFDTETLRKHLMERVGDDFEILMVHSSVNHMQPMYTGTPLELVRMLCDWCGPTRTLVMPAFYFGDPAIGGVVETFRAHTPFRLAAHAFADGPGDRAVPPHAGRRAKPPSGVPDVRAGAPRSSTGRGA